MNRIFVYGTLLKDLPNHDRFLATSVFGERIKTKPAFTLISLGHFPGLCFGGETAVEGETYSVGHATLAGLDRLEGHPGFYTRTEILLEDDSLAEAYLLPRIKYADHPIIKSGSWREHVAKPSRRRA